MWSYFWYGINMGYHCMYTVVPLVLRPPMGSRKKVVLYCRWANKGHLTQKIALWDQIKRSYNQGWS